METKQLQERRTAEYTRRRISQHENYARKTESALKYLNARVAEIDAAVEGLQQHVNDLVVLVRKTPGPSVTVYHSSTSPCGRVNGVSRSRSSFNERFEGEARTSGLTRCTACTWPPRDR